MHILEVSLNKIDIKNSLHIIQTCLFQCECVIYMIDILDLESFNIIKELIPNLNLHNPYTKNMILLNKEEEENESNFQVKEDEIDNLINNNDLFIKLSISIKNSINYNKFIELINEIITKNENNFFSHLITESDKIPKNLKVSYKKINIVLLGDSLVGKTSFLQRYFQNIFSPVTSVTIGIDSQIKIIKIKGETYKIMVWDTAGQEKYRSIPKTYYQNADGILLLFDVGYEESFNNISNWIKEINNNCTNQQHNVQIILIGNKIDNLNRVISYDEANKKAHELNIKYFDVSCQYNINVKESIFELILDCYSKNKNHDGKNSKIILDNTNKKKKGCCS